MRRRMVDVLQKTALIMTVFSLLFVHGSDVPKSSAADNNLGISANTTALDSRIKAKDVDPSIRASIEKSYGKLPLRFEVNKGQVDNAVKYLSRGSGYTLFLTSTEAVLSLRRGSLKKKEQMASRNPEADESQQGANDVIRLKLMGANPNPKITGVDELSGKNNYFIGNDPAMWRTDVSNYEKVKIEDVYPGIDLVYYGNQRQLEYDWIVRPGADPKTIHFVVDGKPNLKIDGQGDLLLNKQGDLGLNKPFIYQQRAGARVEIAGSYILLGKREVGFQLDKYDGSLPLVIDPVLSYSTYLGGNSTDQGLGVAVDSSGNAYVTGKTSSTDFPIENPFQANYIGGSDVFVTKLNASGNSLIYSTYLGGRGPDDGFGISVDSFGNAYVAGYTWSFDFPTVNAIQASYGGMTDAFVTKLNASGSALVFSTYIGGSDLEMAYRIALDSSGNAYVTGETASTDFPTANAFRASIRGTKDAFVTKLNAAGSTLIYSTYLGGDNIDWGCDIAADSSGNAYITGETESTNFPTANPLQASIHGAQDAFITKLNAAGSALIYSTYFGSTGLDYGIGIAVDSAGNAYVTGVTNFLDFPTVNPIQASFGGGQKDAFVMKLSASGSSLAYSTFLGGNDTDYGFGIAVDSSGNAYVTGLTRSTNFPTVNPSQANHGGQVNHDRGLDDAFIAKLNALGNALVYSTYLGGNNCDTGYAIAVDSSGNAYVTGWTSSSDFPTANAFQASYSGYYDDAFVTKIQFSSSTFGDVDSDGKADLTVYRPSSGVWYTLLSKFPGSYTSAQWGLSNDEIVPGDFDGDGKMDTAVWRPSSGVSYILKSSAQGGYTCTQWGVSSDIPVSGDYDGDGKADIAVWRPSTGVWYVQPSGSPGTYTARQWGISTDIPVPGDYDGDSKTDIAVWRPSTGIWYMLKSSATNAYTSMQWGVTSDIPVPGDYDGDGKTDIAVWRPDSGDWYFRPSNAGGYTATSWGTSGDTPVSGDYDGDGKADMAVWRPDNGVWYVRLSGTPGSYTAKQWGLIGDNPVSSLTTILNSIP
jgi:hypothetical protein